MPAAGDDPEERKLAHMKWAQRYNDRGDVPRALAHFGRALEYIDMASFGVKRSGKRAAAPEKQMTPITPMQTETPVRTNVFKKVRRPVCKVCKKQKELACYVDTSNDKKYRLCDNCAKLVVASGIDDVVPCGVGPHDGTFEEDEDPDDLIEVDDPPPRSVDEMDEAFSKLSVDRSSYHSSYDNDLTGYMGALRLS